MPQITQSQLVAFAPNLSAATAATYVPAINAALAKFGIDQSLRRIRYFMAQVFHETQGLTRFTENLMYTTPQVIANTWPTRFTTDPSKVGTHALDRQGRPYPQALQFAADFASNPTKLAGAVYDGRTDLGNTHPGDGAKYLGRGGFHLTGLSNYDAYSHRTYGDNRITLNPELVAEPVDAFLSAGDYWNTRKYTDTTGRVWTFSQLADADQFTFMSISIQGSAQSVPQRLQALNQANKVFTG